MWYQHYCDYSHFTDEKLRLCKGLGTLLSASERYLDLHLFLRVHVPALEESILPPQSQAYPPHGQPIQQSEMTSHIWAAWTTEKNMDCEGGKVSEIPTQQQKKKPPPKPLKPSKFPN